MEPNSSEIKLCTLLSHGWLYRGEGNANIVLSLPKTHQILRIGKTKKPRTVLGWFFDWLMQILKWDLKKIVEHEKRNLDFYNKVMIPVLGKAYAQPATNIDTCRSDIQKLDKKVMLFRPENRKHKRLQYGTASVFTDYAFLSEDFQFMILTGATYAVEVKPKQGWIPEIDRNFSKCQFCLNQHLKLQNQQIKKLSSYCPLDLFSGEKERMTQALRSLIINPQNNFRIFKDGIYCYGENVSVQTFNSLLHELFLDTDSTADALVDDFCDLMEQALLTDFNKNNGCVNCDCNVNILPQETAYLDKLEEKGCIFRDSRLPLGCVLEKILSLQKLNQLGLNKYCDIYKALIRNKLKFDSWSYVEKFLLDISCNRPMCLKCVISQQVKQTQIAAADVGAISDLDLIPYLIAAVANDCSFMITFRKICEFEDIGSNFIIRTKHGNFVVNVGIFDLYPKPVSTIEKHIKRNLKMQTAFICKNVATM